MTIMETRLPAVPPRVSYAAVSRRPNSVSSKPAASNSQGSGTQAQISGTQAQASEGIINTEMLSDALDQMRQEDSDGFHLVAPKHKAGFKPVPVETGIRRRQAFSGSAKGASLTAGPDIFHVQITNVSPQTNEQTIKEYINGQDESVKVNEIKDTTTDGWETKRFILTFDKCYFDKVMENEFWAEGIYYKQWYVDRKLQSKKVGVF